jgi:hypothetical protein
MVGHQHPGPHFHARRGGLFGHQPAIGHVVVVAEEGLRPPVPPLGHVVRQSGKDAAREAGHDARLCPADDAIN